MYNAELGRWMAVDPLAEDYESRSPYEGIGNNPVNFIDPDGRGWLGDFFADLDPTNPDRDDETFPGDLISGFYDGTINAAEGIRDVVHDLIHGTDPVYKMYNVLVLIYPDAGYLENIKDDERTTKDSELDNWDIIYASDIVDAYYQLQYYKQVGIDNLVISSHGSYNSITINKDDELNNILSINDIIDYSSGYYDHLSPYTQESLRALHYIGDMIVENGHMVFSSCYTGSGNLVNNMVEAFHWWHINVAANINSGGIVQEIKGSGDYWLNFFGGLELSNKNVNNPAFKLLKRGEAECIEIGEVTLYDRSNKPIDYTEKLKNGLDYNIDNQFKEKIRPLF